MRTSLSNQGESGLTLSEVTLTLGIIGIGMVTVFGLLGTGLQLHSRSGEQTTAIFIAEQVFADLSLPVDGVAPGATYGRFLGSFYHAEESRPVDNGVDVYGEILDFSEPQIPENPDDAPICWLFDRHLRNLSHSSSTDAFRNGAETIYADGSEIFNAEYLVAIRVTEDVLFGEKNDVEIASGDAQVALAEQYERADDTKVERLVMVSVEAPASAPSGTRRKYQFQKILSIEK